MLEARDGAKLNKPSVDFPFVFAIIRRGRGNPFYPTARNAQNPGMEQ